MKKLWFWLIIVLIVIYVFGMLYYDSKLKKGASLSPQTCSCFYQEGEFFTGGMIVTDIKKDTCVAANTCNLGYCIIEYGNPASEERFTTTVFCK